MVNINLFNNSWKICIRYGTCLLHVTIFESCENHAHILQNIIFLKKLGTYTV